MIFHVFWSVRGGGADFFLPPKLPRGGDTAKLRRVQSWDTRTGAHNFTCLLNNPPHYQLYYISALIVATFTALCTQMKQQEKEREKKRERERKRFKCELISLDVIIS